MGSWTSCPPCLLAAGDGRSSFSVRQRDHCAGSAGVRRNLQKTCHSECLSWDDVQRFLCFTIHVCYSTWLLLWWDVWYLFLEVLVALVQTTSNCLVDAVDCVSGSGKNTVRLELVQWITKAYTHKSKRIVETVINPIAGRLWCIQMCRVYLYVLTCTCMYVISLSTFLGLPSDKKRWQAIPII